jgi:2-methylcitrate dehydratase PrpD
MRRLQIEQDASKRKMTNAVTGELACFAAELEFEQIPKRVRDYCELMLLDTLACAVAGHMGEETHQVAALTAALAQSKENSIIAGECASLAGATVLNGFWLPR